MDGADYKAASSIFNNSRNFLTNNICILLEIKLYLRQKQHRIRPLKSNLMKKIIPILMLCLLALTACNDYPIHSYDTMAPEPPAPRICSSDYEILRVLRGALHLEDSYRWCESDEILPDTWQSVRFVKDEVSGRYKVISLVINRDHDVQIPWRIADLTHLEYFYITMNGGSKATIPDEFFDIPLLRTLEVKGDVSFNIKLLAKLQLLKKLTIRDTQFGPDMLSPIGELYCLERLEVNGNKNLIGKIPFDLPGLQSGRITWADFSDNNLTDVDWRFLENPVEMPLMHRNPIDSEKLPEGIRTDKIYQFMEHLMNTPIYTRWQCGEFND